jgi:hypothetical protein
MVVVPRAGVATAPKIQRGDDGREYVAVSDLTVPPGGALELDIAGLPTPAAWQAWARALAAVIVIALAALAVLVAARRPRAVGPSPSPPPKRQELYARRDRLYAELVALERARAAGKVAPAAFDAQRKGIMTRLVLVHRQLDELDARPPSEPQAPP